MNRCDDVYLAVRAEGDQVKTDAYITLSQSGPEHLQDVDSSSVRDVGDSEELNVLKVQLRQAEETAHKVQREVTQNACFDLKSPETFCSVVRWDLLVWNQTLESTFSTCKM